MSKTKQPPKKHRRFMVQTDLVHPETGESILSEERLLEILKEKNLKAWAYVLHDKDISVDKDGNKKQRAPHWHICLWLENANTHSAISKWFDIPENFVEHEKASWGAMITYLSHELEPDKYQYEDDSIKAKFGYDWKADRERYLKSKEEKISKEELDELIRMCADGTIREYDHHKHIPAMIYINHEKRFLTAFNYFLENVAWKAKNPKRVMFIAGISGAGKTHLAQQLAEEQNEKPFISSGGNDVMDGYRGERVIIFDDFRGENWTIEQLLKLTDPYTNSKTWSRFKSKSLAAADVIIFTFRSDEDMEKAHRYIHKPKELDEFFSLFSSKTDEDINQWYRRVEVFTRVVNREHDDKTRSRTSYYYAKINSGAGNYEDWELQGTREDLYNEVKESLDTASWLDSLGVNTLPKTTYTLPRTWKEESKLYDEKGEPAVPF